MCPSKAKIAKTAQEVLAQRGDTPSSATAAKTDSYAATNKSTQINRYCWKERAGID